jgi:Na+/H+ antiporter NhaD/arsenite permease-like protein
MPAAAPPTAQHALWAVPFAGVLLSIAVLPVIAPRFWARRMAAVTLGWVIVLLAQEAMVIGPRAAVLGAGHALLTDYLPFVTLLLAFYMTGSGILLRGAARGTPLGNTLLLAAGTLLGGFVGTIGASMVLIHPLLRANAHRRHKVHLVVFFIILVANAGGALSPLGAPLYVGLLRNVPFLYPLLWLGPMLVVIAAPLLAAFYLLDRRLSRQDPPPGPPGRFRFRGWINVALALFVVATVIAEAVLQLGTVTVFGEPEELARLIATGLCIAVAVVSAAITPLAVRQANDFSWHPMAEVAILFAGIFVTIAPVTEMLQEGLDGPLAPLLRLTSDASGQPVPAAFFWLAGILSAFLDNTPTYLVFLKLIGNEPAIRHPVALQALSAGAVFFGGLTYIGNAPNLILRAIAAHRGVHMPSFFTFSLRAAVVLVPALVLASLLFFARGFG